MNIETLKDATSQEVFDFIAQHLLKQNKRSVQLIGDEYRCVYRNPNGLKCAAGCLFTDKQYNKKFEDKYWSTLIKEDKVPREHAELIQRLQNTHDLYPPEAWKEELTKITIIFGLNSTVCA